MNQRRRAAAEQASATWVLDVLTRESPDLLRYLERRLALEDAADALSEVVTTAWRRVHDVPLEAEPARMWLFGVARNIVLAAQRSDFRRSGLADRLQAALMAESREHDAADAGLDVRDAVDRLAPEQAELVRLIHWDGFTIAQASNVLGISPSTGRTRYQRARADLRAALDMSDPPGHPQLKSVNGMPSLGAEPPTRWMGMASSRVVP